MKDRQDLSRRDFIRKSMMAGSAMFLSGILPINGKGMKTMPFDNNESGPTYSDSMLKGVYDIHLHAAPDSKARLKNELEFTQDAKNAGYKALLFKSNDFNWNTGDSSNSLGRSVIFRRQENTGTDERTWERGAFIQGWNE